MFPLKFRIPSSFVTKVALNVVNIHIHILNGVKQYEFYPNLSHPGQTPRSIGIFAEAQKDTQSHMPTLPVFFRPLQAIQGQGVREHSYHVKVI